MTDVAIHCQSVLETELVGKKVRIWATGTTGVIDHIVIDGERPIFVKLDTTGQVCGYHFTSLFFI